MAGRKAKQMEAFGISVTYRDIAEIIGIDVRNVRMRLSNFYNGNATELLKTYGYTDELKLRVALDALEAKRAAEKICGITAGEDASSSLSPDDDGTSEEEADTVPESAEEAVEEVKEEEPVEEMEKKVEEITEQRLADIGEKLLLKKMNIVDRICQMPEFKEAFEMTGGGADLMMFYNALREAREKRFLHLVLERINWEEFE